VNIAYVTAYDARDVLSWSGLGQYIARALRSHAGMVDYIGPLDTKRQFTSRATRYAYRRLLRKNYLPDRNPAVLRGYARQVERELPSREVDLVFSPGSLPVAYVSTPHPIAFWTDACFAAMVDFYEPFKNLSKRTLRTAHEAEQAALARASRVFYTSEWAAEAAITSYDVDPGKIEVVPFGANLDDPPDEAEAERLVDRRSADTCAIAFLAVDWDRKGGDIALAVVEQLTREGVHAELVVVGCEPPPRHRANPLIRREGFVSKATAEGRARLRSILAVSHFLIMPSRAEAYGLAFCEANAFAVPALGTAVGGIPAIIRSGRNGEIFPRECDAGPYSEFIAETVSNPARYKALAMSSYNEFRERLNWDVAGRTVAASLREVVDAGSPRTCAGDAVRRQANGIFTRRS
jgi:glycosyltransferase involved in cell wall biosynthesis